MLTLYHSTIGICMGIICCYFFIEIKAFINNFQDKLKVLAQSCNGYVLILLISFCWFLVLSMFTITIFDVIYIYIYFPLKNCMGREKLSYSTVRILQENPRTCAQSGGNYNY